MALFIALFAEFFGQQANEIVRLIRYIETHCGTYYIWLGEKPDTYLNCSDYDLRILLFYTFIVVWMVTSTFVTLKLFDFLNSKKLQYSLAVVIALSLPTLLLFKYLSAVYYLSDTSNIPTIGDGTSNLYMPGEPEKAPLIFNLFSIILSAIILIYGIVLSAFSNKVKAVVDLKYVFASIFFAAIFIYVFISFVFAYEFQNLFGNLGVLNTIILYLLLAYIFLGGLFYYSRTTGVPFVLILIVWIVVVNLSGWNARRPIVPTSDIAAAKTGASSLENEFVRWMKTRRDYNAGAGQDTLLQGEPYPVYIIASAGGGTYAAARSAFMLSYLQKICPAFAHHIFAISSVSGGGLGALAFMSQQQLSGNGEDLRACDPPTDDRALDGVINIVQESADKSTLDEKVLDAFFQKDLLSTIIGAGLFPDMLLRVLPFYDRHLDRSVAFQKALGQHWHDAVAEAYPDYQFDPDNECAPDQYFTVCQIAKYWDPKKDTPLLVFNTTDADNGLPIILARLGKSFHNIGALSAEGQTLTGANFQEYINKSIPLIEGASLSARFPVTLPAGFLKGYVDAENWFRLVDGGYFDTSGLITAEYIKRGVERLAAASGYNVKVRLIFLGERFDTAPTGTSAEARSEFTTETTPAANRVIVRPPAALKIAGAEAAGNPDQAASSKNSEMGAHGLALIKSRDQRSNFIVNTYLNTIDNTLAFRWDYDTKQIIGEVYCHDVPLAWYLAPCTMQLLKTKLDAALGSGSSSMLSELRKDLAR